MERHQKWSIAFCFCLIAGSGRSAAAPADSIRASADTFQPHGSATLTVQSQLPGVRVVFDSIGLGNTPLEHVPIDTGTHVVFFVHPDDRSWFHPTIRETLTVSNGDRIERTAAFPPVYHITSEPYGADVRARDSLVGTTPMILTIGHPNEFVAIAKRGFTATRVALQPTDGEVHVDLQSVPGGGSTQPSMYLSTQHSRNSLPIYLTTGASVLAGATAAYFKIKADRYYSNYQNSNDPAALDRTKKFDVFSGVALAVSQINFVALAYLLLSR